MKDIPHHIKKLNRQVERSAAREHFSDETWKEEFTKPKSVQQKKKQAKKQKASAKKNHPSHPFTLEEKNQLQKHRTPIIHKQSHKNPPAK